MNNKIVLTLKDPRTGKKEYYTARDLILSFLSVVIAFTIVFGGLGLLLLFKGNQ